MRSWRELIDWGWQPELAWLEQAKLLETVLRAVAPEEIPEAAVLVVGRWQALGQAPSDLMRLLKTVFNDVSLSPWTGFVENALAFVQALVKWGEWLVADEVDFLGWLLRELCRHLTAYDLVTFHHRGANYPDALLLDAALKRLLVLAKQEPKLFLGDSAEKLLRRRALRQGVLLRRSYEGHAVPDAPTSPGENTRVLPAPHVQVPDEQFTNPLRRQRKLFADEPLANLWTPAAKEILRQCFSDLVLPPEMNELGMAIFIDRPFGLGKAPLEPDQTPLLAHEVWSGDIARRRQDELAALCRDCGMALPAGWQSWCDSALRNANLECFFDAKHCVSLDRPVAGLADTSGSNNDFWIVRTLLGSLRQLQDLFAWDALYRHDQPVEKGDRTSAAPQKSIEKRRAEKVLSPFSTGCYALQTLWDGAYCKCVRVASTNNSCGVLVLMEGNHRKRVVFEVDPGRGFRCRGGVELPVAGLRIWQVMEDDGTVHDLRRTVVHVLPRF